MIPMTQKVIKATTDMTPVGRKGRKKRKLVLRKFRLDKGTNLGKRKIKQANTQFSVSISRNKDLDRSS